MKHFLFLPSLFLTLSVHAARAQAVDAVAPAVRLDQLAVGVRQPLSATNHQNVERASKTILPTPVPTEAINADSTKASRGRHIGSGAAIGAVVGTVAGLVASKQEHSAEVYLGTTPYLVLGAAGGAILGALVGWWVYFQY